MHQKKDTAENSKKIVAINSLHFYLPLYNQIKFSRRVYQIKNYINTKSLIK